MTKTELKLKPNHWIELEDLHDLIRGRTKEAERESSPRGRPVVSTNPDPKELPEMIQKPVACMDWSKDPDTYIAEVCLVWPQWVKMHLILERLEAPGKE